MKKRIYHIGISGSYGGLNLGDEAILQSIIAGLTENLNVKIKVFSRDAEDTYKRHKIDKAVDVRKLSLNEIRPEIADLDLFILGGGGILYDSELDHYIREVNLANELKIPVFVYAIGAGPLKEGPSREIIKEALNGVSVITVRDRSSQKLLESLGVTKEIIVTADPALLMQPEELPPDFMMQYKEKKKKLVGFSVREPGNAAPDIDDKVYHALLANAADFIIDRLDADILFIPMESNKLDQQHSHAVISLMQKPQNATVLKGDFTSGQILKVMDNLSLAVGMRLHFLIFAALRNVPVVGLPYSSKVEVFLEELGLTIPPIKLVNAGRLIAYIDHYWDTQKEVKKIISKKMPELKGRAEETRNLLLNFIEKNL